MAAITQDDQDVNAVTVKQASPKKKVTAPKNTAVNSLISPKTANLANQLMSERKISEKQGKSSEIPVIEISSTDTDETVDDEKRRDEAKNTLQ